MAKTRNQARNLTIKKEEEEDYKPNLGFGSARNTRRSSRIAKRRPPIINNIRLPIQQVKVEENTNTKSILQSASNHSTLEKGQQASQEQINQLIHYIVNEKIGIPKAARKAKLSYSTGFRYYNLYRDDPERKIPTARKREIYTKRVFTQEHVQNLIKYITNDNMSLTRAAAKANINYRSARYYYNKYLEDPDNNIPIPYNAQACTQEQREKFIDYIVNDKMSIRSATKKANIDSNTAKKTCDLYFRGENPTMPAPNHIAPRTRYTQEQINEAIGYIVDDKMSIPAASRKANVIQDTVRKNYRQYLIDNNMEVPVPRVIKRSTQEEKDQLIHFIFDEKMPVKAAARRVPMYYGRALKLYHQYVTDNNIDASTVKYAQDQIDKVTSYIVGDKIPKRTASEKANMPLCAGNRYYYQYLNDNHLDPPAPKYTQDQVDTVIGYIVDDKMTIKAASVKANIKSSAAHYFYRRYLKNRHLELPTQKITTQDQINQLIRYIEHDKMTLMAASKKANMCTTTGGKYYRQYLKDNDLYLRPPRCPQEQVDKMISYIMDDKMTLTAASKKSNICEATARKYYHQYLKDRNLELPTVKFKQAKIDELIGYLVDDEMTLVAASKKANMNSKTARTYYRQYLRDNNLDVPVPRRLTQDEIDVFIGYVVRDKMSVKRAAKKANLGAGTGHRYYHIYLNSQKKNDPPTRHPRVVSAPKKKK
jgi:transposase